MKNTHIKKLILASIILTTTSVISYTNATETITIDPVDAAIAIDYVDPIFGEFTKEKDQLLQKEFERHYNIIDPLYNSFYTTDSEEQKESIKKQMTTEINNHYDNLLKLVDSSEGEAALSQEKAAYIASLEQLDEEWEEAEEISWEEELFGKNADWEKIESIFEKYNQQIDNFFLQMERNASNNTDNSLIKKEFISLVNTLYQELLPHTTQQGKELLQQEKKALVDYITHFEHHDDYETVHYDEEIEEEDYLELKDLSESEYQELETIWQNHDEKMETFYHALENNSSSKETVQKNMIQEIESVYVQLQPYVTKETQQFLTQEKDYYIQFVQEEIASRK